MDSQYNNNDSSGDVLHSSDGRSLQCTDTRQTICTPVRRLPFAVYMAKYSYDPVQYSPNDNPDVELTLTAGDFLFIYGDMDEDGFFEGELMDGKRGLVPSNFIEKVPDEELRDFHCVPLSLQNGAGSAEKAETSAQSVDVVDDRPATNVTITECDDGREVPAPTDLRLERQLSSSFIIAWSQPLNLNPNQIQAYNIHSNGLFLTTVKGDDRTKALLEKLDPSKRHQISVRTVTDRGHSPDHMCTIIIGGEPTQAPTGLHVTNVMTTSAKISWIPANSNFEHIVNVDNKTSAVISPMCFRCSLEGLTPDAEHSVTVVAVDPQKRETSTPSSSETSDIASVTFLTLPEDLPNAPVDVQVDVGPQRGTLLVTWMSGVRTTSTADPPPGSGGSVGSASGRSCPLAVVTGYAVYVDGTRVKQLDSPTGDHVMLDSRCFASFPADPKQVTVRAAAADRESRDSRPAPLTHQLLEEIRTGMMLTECELGRSMSPEPDATSSSPSAEQSSLLPDAAHFNGTSNRSSKMHNGGRIHPRSVPHIEITLDSLSGGSSGGDDSDSNNARRRATTTTTTTTGQSSSSSSSRRRIKETSRAQQQQQQQQQGFTGDMKTRSGHDTDPRQTGTNQSAVVGGTSRHQQQPQHAGRKRDTFSPAAGATASQRDDITDVLASDPETIDDSLVGDSDENSRQQTYRSYHADRHSARGMSRVHRQYGSAYRVFIALFDYNPATMSPNRDALDEELPFCEGQLLKIYGQKDSDGFYLGESEGHRGLVPCNMVSEVQVDSPEIAERLLRENPTPPPSRAARIPPGKPSPGGRTRDSPRHHRPAHEAKRRGVIPRESSPMRNRVPPRKMVAIYDYNPQELSPNVDVEKELPFKMGDVITVYGEVDFDGFYRGELDGRRGLVPSNFLRPSPNDDRRQPASRHHHSPRYAIPNIGGPPGLPLGPTSPPPLSAVPDPRDPANGDGSKARPLQAPPSSRRAELELGQSPVIQRSPRDVQPLPPMENPDLENMVDERSVARSGERYFSGGNEQQPLQQMRLKHRRT